MQNNIKPSLEEIEKAIIDRDEKDAEIDRVNRTELVKAGLKIIQPKKIIKIDTGKVIGVPNVVDLIKKEIGVDDKIIAVEGESGCGKSSTAKMLASEYTTGIISASDIFRYLTYFRLQDKFKKLDEIIAGIDYKFKNDGLYLFNGNVNITKDLHSELHTHQIDINVAEMASISQAEVINFLNKKLMVLTESVENKIIMEGRAFTLDFLPCDLRIILYANIKIRAERRIKQIR